MATSPRSAALLRLDNAIQGEAKLHAPTPAKAVTTNANAAIAFFHLDISHLHAEIT